MFWENKQKSFKPPHLLLSIMENKTRIKNSIQSPRGKRLIEEKRKEILMEINEKVIMAITNIEKKWIKMED